MSAPTDALRTKTDAELRYYVENPQLYQPDLVAAAQRELRRRGIALPAAPAAPAPVSDYAETYFDEPARPRPWLVPLLVVLGALGLGAGLYWWRAAASAAKVTAAAQAARLAPDSLKLETAAATPLPTFDVEQDIARQLKLVPAAELKKVSTQEMRQYRAVSRRFWLAEHPTEFILSTAAAGKVANHELLVDQIHSVERLWHDAGNAFVYSYSFPPTMADHVARMRSVMGTERQVLEAVKVEASQKNQQLLSPPNAMKHEADEALLEGLRHPTKPIEVHL